MTSKTPQVNDTEWAGPDKHYHPCADGHPRHWGPDGAAGVLVWMTCDDGVTCVLLAKRSKHVQQGGTWAFPGGAVDQGEDKLSAAIRELNEEITGVGTPKGLTGELTAPCPHGCGWTYTSYVIEVRPQDGDVTFARVAPGHSSWETADVGWFPVDVVSGLNLHPAFAKAWPTLRSMIERVQG